MNWKFEIADLVYVKLQLYQQASLKHRTSEKLAARFYKPFEVVGKGKVAYELKLPLYQSNPSHLSHFVTQKTCGY